MKFRNLILKARTLNIFYTKKQLYLEQWRKRLYLLRYDICSFLEFLFIIFIVIPILLPFVMLQSKIKKLLKRRINENKNSS